MKMIFKFLLSNRKLFILILFAVFIVGFSFQTNAESAVSVTLRVGPSDIRFTGYTSPQATITFIENGGVIGTSVSDDNGSFSRLFADLEPGIHTISLYSSDQNGLLSPTLTYNISVSLGTTTEINDIILPSSIEVDNASPPLNGTVIYSGLTVPNATIHIFLDSLEIDTVTAGTNGEWSYSLNTTALAPGNHHVYIYTNYMGVISENSSQITISVRSPSSDDDDDDDGNENRKRKRTSTGTSVTTPQAFISDTITEIVTEITNPILKLFPYLDKNESGIIELDELYDTMKTWVDKWRADEIEKCDLNNDGFCNIIDWSIALYFINR